MKYIDADLLRKEIEKRLKNVRDYMNGAGMRYKGPKYFKAQGKESAYDALLSIIDSLQQEQTEVDLEEYIENEVKHYGLSLYEASYGTFSASQIDRIIRNAFELGVNARMESLLILVY